MTVLFRRRRLRRAVHLLRLRNTPLCSPSATKSRCRDPLGTDRGLVGNAKGGELLKQQQGRIPCNSRRELAPPPPSLPPKETGDQEATNCVICWEAVKEEASHGCEACRQRVCLSCADRYLESAASKESEPPPSCPLCRSPTWCVSLLEDRAGRLKDIGAAFAVGLLYMDMHLESGGDEIRSKAIRFLQLAADEGNEIAAHNLGTLLMSNDQSEIAMAKKYLRRAGLPVSLLNLANVYRACGERKRALRAIRKAARALCGPAFYMLAQEYRDGSVETPRNPRLARRLLEVAAALGDLRALKFLAHKSADACTAAAFLCFVKNSLSEDDLDPEDRELLAAHNARCPSNEDNTFYCPAATQTCLCSLIPQAFQFIEMRRATLQADEDALIAHPARHGGSTSFLVSFYSFHTD